MTKLARNNSPTTVRGRLGCGFVLAACLFLFVLLSGLLDTPVCWVAVGHPCRQCGNYYRTAEQRDRHVARRHGKKSTPTKSRSTAEADSTEARLREAALKHQVDLARAEAAARAREVERMEAELKRAQQQAPPVAAAPATPPVMVAAANDEALQRLRQCVRDQEQATVERESRMRSQLRDQADELERLRKLVQEKRAPAPSPEPRAPSDADRKFKDLYARLQQRDDEVEALEVGSPSVLAHTPTHSCWC